MRNPLARFRRAPVEINQPIELHLEELAPEVSEHIRALTAPREPTVDEVREEWHALYDEQTGVLESVVAALEAQTAIVDQARNLMVVLAQRTHSGNALFLINDHAGPGEADTLRHAIVTLQAMLEGTELPDMVAVDRVTH